VIFVCRFLTKRKDIYIKPIAFKSLPRSPIVSKIQLANRSRFQPRNANTNRYLSYRTKLDAIKEEEEEECRQTRDLYRELDAYRDGSGIGHQDEDDEMAWDDETTLVAMLEDKWVPIAPTYMLSHLHSLT
jgi:hypothetical protein